MNIKAIAPIPSLIGVAGLISGISLITTPTPAQALGIVPFSGFPSITNGEVSLLTTSSATVSSNSVTVNGGALLNPLVSVGGAGYLYEATSAGSITFDWEFNTSNPESFFGFALFADRNRLTETLRQFGSLSGSVDESFYNNFTYALLKDGATGNGQYKVDFKAGNIFGFGVALEGADAARYAKANKLPSVDVSLGSFTITPRVTSMPRVTAPTAPQNVPTPAAVLPIITGLFAAAKRRSP